MDPVLGLAADFVDEPTVLFFGRHVGYPVALEGALKLKELAYIHAEGFAAGELKHGPIALIEDGLPVFVIMPPRGRDLLHEKLMSNVAEIRARGARTIVLAEIDDDEIAPHADVLIRLPKVSTLLQPLTGHDPLADLRLRAGHPAGPRRRPAAQPGQVRHGRVTRLVEVRRNQGAGAKRPRATPARWVVIVGVGIDVCDVRRFAESIERHPGMVQRLFTPAEAERPVASQAARFAAKEALAKALGAPSGMSWQDAEVLTDADGKPSFKITGTVAQRAASTAHRHHPRLAVPRRRDRVGRGGVRGLMRYAYSVAVTRDLEAVAMAAAGDDALMQRAAHGLSVRVAAELQRRRGSVVGASVVILVGPGNNGGDALFAGARLARRGCRVEAVAALGQPHPEGLRALLAVGGRLRSTRRRRAPAGRTPTS